MDIQTVCLGILSFGEATGYDIKQRFGRTYRNFFAAGYGSIYPALATLAEAGLIMCREESSRGGRPRKIYSLTPQGSRELLARLAHTRPRHRVRSDFMLLMFLADLMEPERIEAVIDERREEICSHIAHLREIDAAPYPRTAGTAFTRGLGLAILGTTLDYLDANRDAFVTALRERRRGDPSDFHPSLSGDAT